MIGIVVDGISLMWCWELSLISLFTWQIRMLNFNNHYIRLLFHNNFKIFFGKYDACLASSSSWSWVYDIVLFHNLKQQVTCFLHLHSSSTQPYAISFTVFTCISTWIGELGLLLTKFQIGLPKNYSLSLKIKFNKSHGWIIYQIINQLHYSFE